jgi:hypothetical protein
MAPPAKAKGTSKPTKPKMPSAPTPTTYDDFFLKFEVAIVEHLGLNLYSEVHSAISELIANAWDADAKQVNVRLPVNEELGHHSQEIVITDDGHGMTYEDARDLYLSIGQNRRKAGRSKSRVIGRKAIGKKGIGKLAGFGIADEVAIRSVAPTAWKDGKPVGPNLLTEFVMDWDAIRRAPTAHKEDEAKMAKDPDAPDVTRVYKPLVLHKDEPVDELPGTVVTLRRLRKLDAVELEDFVTLLTRKFAVFDSKFAVTIEPEGGTPQPLTRFDLPCSIRYPEKDGGPLGDGWLKEFIKVPRGDAQPIHYWIGFTENPINRDAERGVSILAGGKQVQEPFLFKLAGGTGGQFGMQYLTGQVEADWLDDDSQPTDVISSDRASIRWTDPRAAALLKWGQDKLKELMKDWVKIRAKNTFRAIKKERPELEREMDSYSGPAREELRLVVDRIASEMAHVPKKRRLDVIQSVVLAYKNDHVRRVLDAVVALPGETSLAGFAEALKEWDLVDAVLTYQELSSKADVLLAFTSLVQGGATEVKTKSPNMSLHEFLAEYPWLIDPSYGEMESERNVDKFLYEKFDYTPPANRATDDLRLDFIAVYRDGDIKLIEIKSAKTPVDERGLTNLEIYHDRVVAAVSNHKAQDGTAWRVRSLLIHNGETPTSETARIRLKNIQRDTEQYQTFVWMDLLRRNSLVYKEMLERVRARNPTDPRIVALHAIYVNRLGAAISAKDRVAARKAKKTTSSTTVPTPTPPARKKPGPKPKATSTPPPPVAPARRKPGPKPKTT